MTGHVRRQRIAMQAIGVVVVALSACVFRAMVASGAPDPASLKIVADTGRSQAIEAREAARLLRAERMPGGIAAHHLRQLDQQVARNRKQLPQ